MNDTKQQNGDIHENETDNNEAEISTEDRSTEKSVDSNNSSKNILVYKNGDKFFTGKRIVINKRYIRTWDSLLEDITRVLKPRTGVIRDIRTPQHGSRVRNLEDLINNGRYIAVAKGESIKLIDYENTTDVNRSPPAGRNAHRQNNEPRLRPIRHVNHDMEKVESKLNQSSNLNIVIHVYRNGDPFTRAINVVLRPVEQTHMSILVRAIEDRVLLQGCRPIRKLYTMDGEKVKFAKDVSNLDSFVAAANEPFIDIKYGQYLPVIRNGKVNSRYRKVKYLNQMPTPKHHQRSHVDQENNDDTARTARTHRSTERSKPLNETAQKKKEKKKSGDEEQQKEEAVIKIQSGIRGYLYRKQLSESQKENQPPPKAAYDASASQQREKEREKKIEKKKREEPKHVQQQPRKTEVKQTKPAEKQYKQTQKNEPKEQKQQEKSKEKKNERKVSEKKEIVENNDQDQAATKIQAGFRAYRTRRNQATDDLVEQEKEKPKKQKKEPEKEKKVEENNKQEQRKKSETKKEETKEEKKEDEKDDNDERQQAATKLQAGFRGYQSRKLMDDKTNAAIKIQAGFRGFQSRKGKDEKCKAASTIQAGYRGYRSRKGKDEKSTAASTIQAGYRGYQSRKKTNNQKEAATKIQAGFRGYKARQEVKEREQAATKIQASFRGHQTRKNQAHSHPIESLSAEDQVAQRNKSAAVVQAGYRGYKQRNMTKTE